MFYSLTCALWPGSALHTSSAHLLSGRLTRGPVVMETTFFDPCLSGTRNLALKQGECGQICIYTLSIYLVFTKMMGFSQGIKSKHLIFTWINCIFWEIFAHLSSQSSPDYINHFKPLSTALSLGRPNPLCSSFSDTSTEAAVRSFSVLEQDD